MTTILEPQQHVLPGRPDRSARPTRPWVVLAVLGIAQLMLVLDATVVDIALPRAQAALHFSDADRQWVVTAYSLGFGSLLLLGGRLADMFGRRRMFVVGLGGFAAASALGGMAGNFAVLVSARALQGGFGAMLAPAALSLLTVTFTEPAARARAFGFFGAISAAGGSIGLMLGGALTQYFSWRWVMDVNVVIAAGGLFAAASVLPADRGSRRHRALDVPGVLLGMSGVFAVVYGFSRAANGSSLSAALEPLTLAFVAAGLALLAGFVVVERRTAQPLLPMRIVLDRNRAGAYASMFLSAIGVFGVLLFLTYYLETVLGYTPVGTGLAFLPMAATVALVGGIASGALITRVSARVIMPPGLLLTGIGLAMLTRIGVQPHYTSAVLPATIVTAVGLGLVFAPSFNLGTAGVDESDAGVASATIHVAQQIGGSIGGALLNTVATTAAARYLTTHALSGHPASLQAHAAVHSYAVVFGVCAAALALAAVVVGALLNPSRRASAYVVEAPDPLAE